MLILKNPLKTLQMSKVSYKTAIVDWNVKHFLFSSDSSLLRFEPSLQ